MTAEIAIIVWLLIVLVSAILASFFAHRWGRDPFGWVWLSAAMGPIALVGLVGTHVSDRAHATPYSSSGRTNGPVVVACDGSAVSVRLASHVIASSAAKADVVLLAVLPYEAQQAAASDADNQAERMTGTVREALEQEGRLARVVVRYGPPGQAIVRLAAEESASLIVLGRRGSGVTRALLGSVSTYVTQQAQAPVAIVT